MTGSMFAFTFCVFGVLVLLGAAVVGCRNWIRFRDSERAELRHRAWVSLAAAAVCFVLAAVAVRVLLRYGFN